MLHRNGLVKNLLKKKCLNLTEKKNTSDNNIRHIINQIK